ncbi:phospholipase C precursor [Oxobacter pfennigii]|uniref:Phospholipase C n=1 Tax=Oxobacter pfennigii TaxID=36849 RepID=A0A0P8WNT1_9CLOT|nr:zinc dependent phospholipase C family protein [Oxobacter pfennigii]KPU44213.1 phospholipase C precursor [Oxobacter pfennigii]
MQGIVERTYGRVFKSTLAAVNPVKKVVIKSECKVHKFINIQSLIILKNDGYKDAWLLFAKHIEELNSGVAWADQDLKSSNHFFNPLSQKGLYGSSNALKECIAYYEAAVVNWKKNDVRKSMFYLGAAAHLIQDLTVPQHVNIHLLKHHRKFENWIKRVYEQYDSFKCYDKGIYLDSLRDFVNENTLVAIDAHNRNKDIKNLEQRFFNITDIILCQAQRSTAGFLFMFYHHVCHKEKISDINC